MGERLTIWIEDLDGTEECPQCGHDFDKSMTTDWEKIDGYHYRSGGKTVYGCPVEDCDGEIEVTI